MIIWAEIWCWTWSECGCGRVVYCHECKCWLTLREGNVLVLLELFFWHDCETGTSEASYWISTGKSCVKNSLLQKNSSEYIFLELWSLFKKCLITIPAWLTLAKNTAGLFKILKVTMLVMRSAQMWWKWSIKFYIRVALAGHEVCLKCDKTICYNLTK